MVDYERVVAEINLDAMAQNVQTIVSTLNKKTQLIAVIKADGYGHGAIETAKVAFENGATILGVAMFDEAMQLRRNGITGNIIILGHTPSSFYKEALENNIIITIFSYDTVKELSEIAVEHKKIAQVHIKIDSGMGRIGFLPTEKSIEEITAINALPNIEITGFYTHLSSSDPDDTEYTFMQRDIFFEMLNNLKENGVNVNMVHVSNSAAVSAISQLQYDAVRAGIILYGLSPFSDRDASFPLVPVMSLKSKISFLKELPKGAYIGYGRTYQTADTQKIATIPVGYADGYMRALSNRGRVLICGEYAPIVGKICMDQFMVDVTHIKDVSVGDEVVMIGRQKDKSITAGEVADVCQTISYEIVCAVGKRVPRAYTKGNTTIKTLKYIYNV